ncbi:UbiX family flavin prenyltransferase [Bosea sp. 117]|uniref:UbiX family flavin prenyltransferase n=1 Tax=Bosea sp. 117 TaxID=1125973 RepID=UPI0004944A99|nr:UbiX family flavin prenyltransferase [Bosea sp. 117]
MDKPERPRIVVGISGASGAVYGVRAIEMLEAAGVETHLIVTRSAHLTISQELGLSPAALAEKASVVHNVADVGASISSGSFRTLGMLIAPCSVRSMSEIATGVTSSLMSRAADVVLKERRKLVLMVRETPLHLGHLRTMTALTEMGAIVMPPVPAFYALPNTLAEMVDHSVSRALDLFGIDSGACHRWTGMASARRAETP